MKQIIKKEYTLSKWHVLVKMKQDYKWLKKWELIDCFNNQFCFDYAWEHDTEIWCIPPEYVEIVEVWEDRKYIIEKEVTIKENKVDQKTDKIITNFFAIN